MDDGNFFSIRMHASVDDRHVSGAERLVSRVIIDETVNELVRRALNRDCAPAKITVTIEDLGSDRPRSLKALDVVTVNTPDASSARATVSRLLSRLGIASHAAEQTMALLSQGASPTGGNMRGAMIVDAKTGGRLEPDRARGVRASRFDWTAEAGRRMKTLLADNHLAHFRTFEAVALATKIAHGPGVLAELCWSDDADYTAGYIASLKTGYVRFPILKEKGNCRGGRAVFVDRSMTDVDALVRYLQTETILISEIGQCGAISAADYSFGTAG